MLTRSIPTSCALPSQGCEGMGALKALWKSVAVSYLVKHTLNIYNPAIPPPGICLRKLKTLIHAKTCMWMFIGFLYNLKTLETTQGSFEAE